MNRIFFVSTENGCNCACMACAEDPTGKPKNGRSEESIVADLKDGVEQGFDICHFAGGELTIQDNCLDLIGAARELYSQVYVTTNGRRLSYAPFAKAFAASGVTHTKITLWGATRKTHERATWTPQSYKETIAGIRELRKYTSSINVNYVVWRESYEEIMDVMLLLKRLGVKHVDLFNVVPLGRGRVNYKKLFVPLHKLLSVEKQLRHFMDFAHIEIEDFPLCVFSDAFINKGNVHVYDTSGVAYVDEAGTLENYSVFAAREFGFCINSNTTVQSELGAVQEKFDGYRQKMDACNGCSKFEQCYGVFTEYVDVMGKGYVEKEIGFLRRKQGF